jgi:hypothetical protein
MKVLLLLEYPGRADVARRLLQAAHDEHAVVRTTLGVQPE